MIAAVAVAAAGALVAVWSFVSIARSDEPFGPTTRIGAGS